MNECFFLLQTRGKDLRYPRCDITFSVSFSLLWKWNRVYWLFLIDPHWPWYDGPWCHAPGLCVIFLLSRIPALQR